jgi:ATP-dependent Clp protease ATP-binding subunit ClpA
MSPAFRNGSAAPGQLVIMFLRFSKPACRVVFFARHEASRVGGLTLSTEHLLLGLLWENSWLIEPFLASGQTANALRRETERAARSGEKQLPTSVEMRLSEPAKMALTYAEEESDRLLSSTIDVTHLLLGLLRTQGSQAAKILTEFGLKVDEVREKVAQDSLSPVQEPFGTVVCTFYGIEIRFDAAAEAVPRIIAEYRGHMALVEIDPVKVVQSNLPAHAESMLLEWTTLRKEEIGLAWTAWKAGKRSAPIAPLE